MSFRQGGWKEGGGRQGESGLGGTKHLRQGHLQILTYKVRCSGYLFLKLKFPF